MSRLDLVRRGIVILMSDPYRAECLRCGWYGWDTFYRMAEREADKHYCSKSSAPN